MVGVGGSCVQLHQHLGQGLGRGEQVIGDGDGGVGRQQLHIGHPQAVGQLPVILHAKALRALALQVQQAGLGLLQLDDACQRAHGMQLLGGRTGLAHFAAGLQCHHAEGGSRALALADHVEVADLEDAKAQQALGKKDAAQGEKRQGVQCGMGGHVMGGMRQLSSHAVPRPAGRGPIFLSQSYNAMLFQIVSFLLDVVVGLLTGVCLLRMYMQAQRIPFGNPVGQLVFALSDWIVMPLRRVIKPAGRWDMSSLIAAFLLQMLQFVLLWLLMGGQSNVVALPWLALCGLARVALSGMVGVLLIYVILSWVQPQSPMYGVLQRLSEPMLRPIRRIVPLIGGIDLSALVALVLLQIALMVLGYIQGSGLMLLA